VPSCSRGFTKQRTLILCSRPTGQRNRCLFRCKSETREVDSEVVVIRRKVAVGWEPAA
jgi:hypothetical protein